MLITHRNNLTLDNPTVCLDSIFTSLLLPSPRLADDGEMADMPCLGALLEQYNDDREEMITAMRNLIVDTLDKYGIEHTITCAIVDGEDTTLAIAIRGEATINGTQVPIDSIMNLDASKTARFKELMDTGE